MGNFNSLIVNPTLRLSNGGASDGAPCWRVSYFSPKSTPCSIGISPALAKVLLDLHHGSQPENVLEQDALQYLIAQNILVPKTKEPRYSCPLPTSLNGSVPSGLVVNPRFSIYADKHKGTQLREYGPWGATIGEYDLDSEAIKAAWAVSNDEPCDSKQRSSLHQVGYLDSPDAILERENQKQSQFSKWRNTFQNTNHTMIDNLVSPVELENLQSYSSRVQRRGFLDGDFGVAGKQRSHVFDDSQLKWLLQRGAQLATKIFGTPLVPSYSFLAFYHSGGVLPPHRDKSHCNISMSLAVDVPELIASTWPLNLQDPNGNNTQLYWGTGETLLFDGRYYQHGRPPMPPSNNAVYLILHFKIHPEYI